MPPWPYPYPTLVLAPNMPNGANLVYDYRSNAPIWSINMPQISRFGGYPNRPKPVQTGYPKTEPCSNTHIANSPSPAKKNVQMLNKESQCANPMSAANVILKYMSNANIKTQIRELCSNTWKFLKPKIGFDNYLQYKALSQDSNKKLNTKFQEGPNTKLCSNTQQVLYYFFHILKRLKFLPFHKPEA